MTINESIIKETTKKVIQEYLGVSDYIMEVSEEIFKMICTQTPNKLWNVTDNFSNPDGSDAYVKWMYLDIEGTETSEVVDSVYVKLYGYDSRKYSYKEYVNILNERDILNLAYAPLSNTIKLIIPFPLNNKLDEYAKNYIITSLNHEVKHAFQSAKRGGTTISKAYTNSVRKKTDFDTKEAPEIHLIKYYTKRLYYLLDNDEIDASLQEIYKELQQNNGNLSECEAYKTLKENIKGYYWLKNELMFPNKESFNYRYYKKIRNQFESILIGELGDGVNQNMFFNYCERGIKRFNEHLRKVIARYRIENNIPSNGSFKQYANGEIPQSDIFGIKRNNPSLWQRILNRFKKR